MRKMQCETKLGAKKIDLLLHWYHQPIYFDLLINIVNIFRRENCFNAEAEIFPVKK